MNWIQKIFGGGRVTNDMTYVTPKKERKIDLLDLIDSNDKYWLDKAFHGKTVPADTSPLHHVLCTKWGGPEGHKRGYFMNRIGKWYVAQGYDLEEPPSDELKQILSVHAKGPYEYFAVCNSNFMGSMDWFQDELLRLEENGSPVLKESWEVSHSLAEYENIFAAMVDGQGFNPQKYKTWEKR